MSKIRHFRAKWSIIMQKSLEIGNYFISTLLYALVKNFAQWWLINFSKDIIYEAKLNRSKNCKFGGQNNQILYKNRETLENICSIYILGSNGVKVCTGVLHYLAKYVSYDVWLNMSKIKHVFLCKNRKNLEKIVVYVFVYALE